MQDTFASLHASGGCGCSSGASFCNCEQAPYPGESHDLLCCVANQRAKTTVATFSLVEHLRRAYDPELCRYEDMPNLLRDAADALEAQAREIKRLRDEIEALSGQATCSNCDELKPKAELQPCGCGVIGICKSCRDDCKERK